MCNVIRPIYDSVSIVTNTRNAQYIRSRWLRAFRFNFILNNERICNHIGWIRNASATIMNWMSMYDNPMHELRSLDKWIIISFFSWNIFSISFFASFRSFFFLVANKCYYFILMHRKSRAHVVLELIMLLLNANDKYWRKNEQLWDVSIYDIHYLRF